MDEALRLLKMSKASLYDDAGAERAVDPISQVFSRIRQHAERTKRAAYSWADLLDFLGTSFKVGAAPDGGGRPATGWEARAAAMHTGQAAAIRRP